MNERRKAKQRMFGGKLIFLALLAVLLVGCAGGGTGTGGGGNGGGGGPVTIVGVETGIDDQLFVNVGTSTTEVVNDYLPAQVTVNLSDSTTQTPTVVWDSVDYDGNTPGDYTFTGSFTAAEIADSVDVTITVRGEIELSSHITSPMTLSADYIYRVTARLNVDAALTIEAGTVLRFEQNTRLNVRNNGSIAAVGTPSNRILFTGTQADRGWWDGLQVHSMNSNNRMEYVTIEYGGGSGFESTLDPTNLAVGGRVTDGRLVLQNSILRHSGGWGLKLREDSQMPDTFDNTFTNNTMGPAKVHVNALHYVDGGSSYIGNDHDYVLADNSRNPAISSRDRRTWQALEVPYRVNFENRIDNSFITIEPGAHFEFTLNAGFVFTEDAVLRVGSEFAASRVNGGSETTLFTGVEKTRGFWSGIQMRNSPTTSERDSILDNVIIEYGGSSAFESSIQRANLVVGGRVTPGQVTLRNSIVRHSGDYGMYLRHTGTLKNSYNNTFTENAEGPIRLTPANLHEMDSGSTHDGNLYGNNFVIVHTSGSDGRVNSSDSRFWPALDVPYRMSGGVAQVHRSHITIQPGTEFRFDNNMGLRFMEDSRLTAVGTENNPILFTGMQQLPGFWQGVQIGSLNDNVMEYVTIEYGGSGTHESSLQPANLTVGMRVTDALLDVRNSTFRDSRGYGIAVTSDTVFINNDFLTVNHFSNNQEGNFHQR